MIETNTHSVPEGAFPLTDEDGTVMGYIVFPDNDASVWWEFVLFNGYDALLKGSSFSDRPVVIQNGREHKEVNEVVD